MTLPAAAPARQLKSRRSIQLEVFARGDGQWEIDAQITDTRSTDFVTAGQVRAAGQPVHHMTLRLVINEKMDILQAGSETAGSPYPGLCSEHGDAYARLVGLNLMQDFRRNLRARLGGTTACTHITELAQSLPSAAVQAFAGTVIDTHGLGAADPKPFQIDRCHALRSNSEAVRLYYPKWFRPGTEQATATGPSPTSPIDSSASTPQPARSL